MKILFINTLKLDKNGISTFIMNNAKYLAQSQYDISILAPSEISNNFKNELKRNGITLLTLDNRVRKPWQYIKTLAKIIKTNKFDVVHVNGNSATMFLELLSAKLAGCKCRVSHAHNTNTEHIFIHKLLYPFFNLLVTDRMACSEAAGRWLYHKRNYYVIKNGVNLSNYRPNLESRVKIRKKFNLESTDILIGNIGYFNLQKNQKFLISIIQNLDKNFKLVLIGDGSLRKSVEKLVKQNGLSSKVIFAGKVENVNEYLSAIDIFIMPSLFEGMPFALIEAQASGLPCIVSNRISQRSNLSNNVKFLSLDDINNWINTIDSVSMSYTFTTRLNNLEKVHSELKKNGYDARQNAEYLGRLFKVISKKQNI